MAEGDGEQVAAWLKDLVEEVRRIHDRILQVSGGMPGEHTSSLFAACARPFQTVLGEPGYADPFQRAAALFHGIICDHVFLDGNKRTATVAAISLLAGEGVVSEGAITPLRVRLLGELALTAASDTPSVDFVTHWIRRIFDENLLSG